MAFLMGSLGVILGGLITWLVAKHYYERASQDLKDEASELRKLNTLVLRGMEEAGLAKFTKDQQGKPVGLQIRLSSRGAISPTSSVSAKVTEAEKSDS